MNYSLKKQRSGALALHDSATGETMHPGLGPWAEATGLYVAASGLRQLLTGGGAAPASPGSPRSGREVVLFDVGLGGAANALAAIACREALEDSGAAPRPLHLVSFEADLTPLRFALAQATRLGYLLGHERRLEALADQGWWEEKGRLRWDLRLGDFPSLIEDEPCRADVVFFDPFSPRRNPGMWSVAALEGLYRCRRPGGNMRLITYSTAYASRAALLLAGFFVGEAQGSSEARGTEAAVNYNQMERPLDRRWLHRWQHDRAPWPPGMDPGMKSGDRRGLRKSLLDHPQWDHRQESGGKDATGGAVAKSAGQGRRRPPARRTGARK